MKIKKIIFTIIAFSVFGMVFAASEKPKDIDAVIDTINEILVTQLKRNSRICVMDFVTPSADLSEYLREGITSELTETGSFKIVTRNEIDKIERELRFQASGYVSDETALSICERLGAQYILIGELKELNNAYNLRVKLLGVETAEYIIYKTYAIKRSMKTEQLLGNASSYKKCDLGLMVEANKNSVHSVSPCVGVFFDYNITKKLTAGLNVLVSDDVAFGDKSIFSFETLGLVRFYVVSPTGEPASGVFVQGNGGAEIIFVDSETEVSFDGGISVGFKKNLGSFYFEAYLRGGYPYLFGAGLGLGVSF